MHHLKYRHLYDVDPKKELMVLCRDCHNRVHELLKKYPKMRTIEPAVHLRGVIKKHLKQKIITVNPSDEEAFLEAIKQRDIKRVVKQKNRDNEYRMRMFGQYKDQLFKEGIIYTRTGMPYKECLNDNIMFFKDAFGSAEKMLAAYIAITGIDKRCWIPDIVRKFPLEIKNRR